MAEGLASGQHQRRVIRDPHLGACAHLLVFLVLLLAREGEEEEKAKQPVSDKSNED